MSKPAIQMQATIITDQKYKVEITGEMIIAMLRETGMTIPDSATVSFTVPGGGDWSNMSIDVDAENPVYAEWQVQSTDVS